MSEKLYKSLEVINSTKKQQTEEWTDRANN